MVEEHGAVGDVFHNDPDTSLRGEAADGVPGDDGRKMLEERGGETFPYVNKQRREGRSNSWIVPMPERARTMAA